MAKRKSALSRGDVFHDDCTAWRLAEMLRGNDGVVSVRAESGDPPWDDIIEELSGERRRAWQARAGARLTLAELAELVGALAERSDLAEGRLALCGVLQITGIHRTDTSHLRRLTENARRLHGAALTGPVERLREGLVQKTGLSAEALAASLRRIHIAMHGDLPQFGQNLLAAMYSEGVVGDVWSALLARARVLRCDPDAGAATAETLRVELAKFDSHRRLSGADATDARRSYVERMRHVLSERPVLRGLEPVRLRDVWVDLRAAQRGSDDVEGAAGLLRRCNRGTTIVVGDAGSGKSELLREHALALLDAAALSPTAPLPIVVDAAKLEGVSLAHAVAETTMRDAEQLVRLVLLTRGPFVLLVDGLDEASGPDVASGAQYDLRGRLDGVVLSTRGHRVPLIADATVVELRPWRSEDARAFLQCWRARAHGDAARSPSTPTTDGAEGALLALPLTATFCALANDGTPRRLSRAQLFEHVVREMFQRWARARPGRNVESWKDVAAVARIAAMEMVVGGAATVPHTVVDALLRQFAPDDDLRVRTALEEHFGFWRHRDAGYEFILRPIAEYLGGQALAETSNTVLCQAGEKRRNREIVRHAVASIAATDPGRARDVVSDLLHAEERDEPGLHNVALPRVLTAIDCIADIGTIPDELAIRVARAVERRVADEESQWVGERVVEAVEALAATGHPLARAIGAEALARARLPGTPASWHAAHPAISLAAALALLRHRDPDVRAVANERMAAHVDAPAAIDHLALELFDLPSSLHFRRAPALSAAMSLRSAGDRNAVRQAIARMYGDSLPHPQELRAVPVAVAALPGERDAKWVVETIKSGGALLGVPATVLEELAETAAGKAALDLHWPDWARAARRDPPPPRSSDTPLTACPPSLVARGRLLRLAVAVGALTDVDSGWADLRRVAPDAAMAALVHVARAAPKRLAALLDKWMLEHGTAVPYFVEDAVREAASTTPEITAALIRLWQSPGREDRGFAFPGRALEPAVEAADAEAVRVYAKWIAVSPQLRGPFTAPPLSPAALSMPGVRETALQIARARFSETTEGAMQSDGVRRRLAPQSAGIALRRLATVWRDDARFRAQIFAWGVRQPLETERLVATVRAFARIGLSREELRDATDAAEVVFDREANEYTFWTVNAPLLLGALAELGVAALRPDWIMYYAASKGDIAIHAAAAVAPALDRKHLSTISRSVSLTNPFATLVHPSDHGLRVMVDAQPDAWVSWACRAIDERPGRTGAVLRVLHLLPPAAQMRVAEHWMQRAGAFELPWMDEPDDRAYRVADLVRGVMFDVDQAS